MFSSNVVFEDLNNKDNNNNNITFVFVSCIVCSSAGGNLKWNETHSRP